MTRIEDDILALHLEVALSGAPKPLLDGLSDADRRRRHAAIATLAQHLTERLRCFEILPEGRPAMRARQPSLFPPDLGPLGG